MLIFCLYFIMRFVHYFDKLIIFEFLFATAHQYSGIREEIDGQESLPSDRRSSTSSSVTGAPSDYASQGTNKHRAPYNTSPSMVHVENCHVSLSLYQGQGGMPTYNQGVVSHGSAGSSLSAVGYPQHPANQPLMHAPHMQQCAPNGYPATLIDPQVVSQNYIRNYRQQQPQIAAAVSVAHNMNASVAKGNYRSDNQDQGGSGSFRGGVSSRGGRCTSNARQIPVRRTNRRQENERSSTSSERNSFSNDRFQYSSEHNSFSEHEVRNHNGSSDMHGQENISHNIGQPLMYNPVTYAPAVRKLEGPPLIMSQPGNTVYYPTQHDLTYNRDRMVMPPPPGVMGDIPMMHQYAHPQYLPPKEINHYVAPLHIIENTNMMPQCVPINGDLIDPGHGDGEPSVYANNEDACTSSNNDGSDYPASRPSTASLEVESGLSVESVEETAVSFPDIPVQPSHSALHSPIIQQVVQSVDELSMSPAIAVTEPVAADLPSTKQKTFSSHIFSSSKVVPILDIRTENKLDLSFTMKFGDICPEEVYEAVNKSREVTSPKTVPKNVRSHEKGCSKSTLTPLFDTSINTLCSSTGNGPSEFMFGSDDCNAEVPLPPSAPSVAVVKNDVVKSTGLINSCAPPVATPVAVEIVVSSPNLPTFVSGVAPYKPETAEVPPAINSQIDSYEGIPIQIVPSKAVAPVTEKPPLPVAPKKQAEPAAPRQQSVVASVPASGTLSAWGKNKNWTEQFKPDSAEKQKKVRIDSD